MTDLPNRPLARIIRAEEAESWISGFVFLERAKAEAADIRSTAELEVAEARERGRDEGRKVGEEEAAALLLRAHTDVERYFASIEPLVASLAMEIVERVIGSFDDAELVARAARLALKALQEENAVVINVAPELVGEVQQRLAAFGPNAMSVRVAADRHLTQRQCSVTTPATSIDVGIDAQFAAIRTAMADQCRNGA
jgi:type III secretion protein L